MCERCQGRGARLRLQGLAEELAENQRRKLHVEGRQAAGTQAADACPSTCTSSYFPHSNM